MFEAIWQFLKDGIFLSRWELLLKYWLVYIILFVITLFILIFAHINEKYSLSDILKRNK